MYLISNKIGSIEPYSFSNLDDLAFIQINDKTFRILRSNTFFNLPKLEELMILANTLEVIEANTFVNLPSIARIYFDENKIIKIDSFTFDSLSVNFIDFRMNKIKIIEKYSFYNLKNCTEIDLRNNYIESIEQDSFYELPILKSIYLKDNPIRSEFCFVNEHYLLLSGYKSKNFKRTLRFNKCIKYR